MEQRARSERPDRRRREAKPRDAGSGEGAASALASLRALERSRDACAPADEASPVPAQRRRAGRQPGAE